MAEFPRGELPPCHEPLKGEFKKAAVSVHPWKETLKGSHQLRAVPLKGPERRQKRPLGLVTWTG